MLTNCDDVLAWDEIEEYGDDGECYNAPFWLLRHQVTNHVDIMGQPCRVLITETPEWVHFMENEA